MAKHPAFKRHLRDLEILLERSHWRVIRRVGRKDFRDGVRLDPEPPDHPGLVRRGLGHRCRHERRPRSHDCDNVRAGRSGRSSRQCLPRLCALWLGLPVMLER